MVMLAEIHTQRTDVQTLRDDAIAYVRSNPLWPTP
jgi:hypothetical protein